MIAYTSMRAYATLYASYNDIDIYVEDSTLIGSYERIFQRLLIGKYRVESIIPFGKKSDVLAEAGRLNGDQTRRRFFLVDGDFDWLALPVSGSNLYELRVYSIENFMLDEDALLSFAGECNSSISNSGLIKKLDFRSIEADIKLLDPLMIAYATARALGSTSVTVNYPLERLINPKTKRLDKELISARTFSFYKNLIREFDKNVVRDFYNEIKTTFENLAQPSCQIVAGKHYLANLLLRKFQKDFSFSGRRAHFIASILEKSGFEADPNFLQVVNNL